jgi:putative endopeptidase
MRRHPAPTMPAWTATLALLAACGPAATPVVSTPAAKVEVAPAEQKVASLADVGLDPQALDKTVDPCQDFYQYACGNWIKKTEIPGDEASWYRSFNEIRKRNELALKSILEEAAKNPGSDPVLQKIGGYYGACMDESAVEAAGLGPVAGILKQVAAWKDKKALPALVADLHAHAIWPFFDIAAEPDMKDATKVIATFDQGGLGLPDRDDYFRDDEKSKSIRAVYQEHVARMLGLAGWKPKDAAVAAADVVRLETALAGISKTRVERRDPQGLYNKIDRVGLLKSAPKFGWVAYLQGMGAADVQDINVTSVKFFEGLDKLIVTTPVPALQHYLAWHVVRGTARSLGKAFVDETFTLEKALSGQPDQKPRWRRCVASTDGALGELLAQPYVAKHFAGDSKQAAEKMVHAINDAFASEVKTLDWMDAATRTKAQEKREQMAFLIGYPDKWKAYDFAIDPKVHVANVLASRAFEMKRDLAKIGKPVDRNEWQMSPPTVNAYYDPQKNHMVFPAGILQPPFFDAKNAVAVNLGGIGMVIGHELTHGFDDEGSQFDGKGNLQNWWSPQVNEQFKARTTCVADQYSTYEVQPGLKVNGKLTLGENIADLGGLKLAFAAFHQLRKDAQGRMTAEGFTEEQMFFLAHAQVWCGKARPEQERQMVQTNPHSPPRFRVNGPLADLPEFSAAFQCKAGSPMRPEKACSVW